MGSFGHSHGAGYIRKPIRGLEGACCPYWLERVMHIHDPDAASDQPLGRYSAEQPPRLLISSHPKCLEQVHRVEAAGDYGREEIRLDCRDALVFLLGFEQ